MSKTIITILLLLFMVSPVYATSYTAPEAPESAQQYMPEKTETFSEDLWTIIKEAISQLQPSLAEAAKVCCMLVVCMLFSSVLKSFSGLSKHIVDLIITICTATILIQSTNAMIHLGIDTVREVSEYGKLLLPVMTSSLAAQGGVTSSAALYTGTAFFDTVLTTGINAVVIPLLYVYLVLCVCYRAIGEEMLKSLLDFVKWLITWIIKTILYVFTGYLGITGVISGTQDAAAIKAAKLTISGAVPIVGNIISDASESILSGIGFVKSSVGIYGLLVIFSIWIGPFLKIGIQYLILKITAAVCGMLDSKGGSGVIADISSIMGFLLAITGTVSLLLMISIVCFIKGVS